MERDHAHHLAVASEHRHRHERLETFFVQFMEVLHARVLQSVLFDHRRSSRSSDPAHQALVEAQADVPRERRVGLRRSPQHQSAPFEEPDQTRVALCRFRREPHHAREHRAQIGTGTDRSDDAVQVLALVGESRQRCDRRDLVRPTGGDPRASSGASIRRPRRPSGGSSGRLRVVFRAHIRAGTLRLPNWSVKLDIPRSYGASLHTPEPRCVIRE